MDWQAVAFDWNQVKAFLATAEEGSFSAAARVLGLTQPTLGRQVAALESNLGVALFERVGRGVTLTAAGRELVDHVRAMGDAAVRLSIAATGQSQSIEGKVRITAADVMAAHVLPPVFRRLRRLAPRLEIDVVASNDVRDLLRREADIAVRHVRPEQPELIARKVQTADAHFYASTAYLDARGRPTRLSDLERHDFIGYGDTDAMIATMADTGLTLTPRHFLIGSENGLVAWHLAVSGLGVSVMSSAVGDATPGMERILPALPPIRFPVWLATHRELHTSRRIRLVFDELARFLSE